MSEKRSSKCGNCPSPATVHLTQIVGGEVKKMHLCEQCAQAKDVSETGAFNIVGKVKPSVKKTGQPRSFTASLACPKCGFTQESFKEAGRLGCPTCYEVFELELEPVLRKLHRGTKHKGKAPIGFAAPVVQEEIEALKRELQEHVEREDYEKAAVVRDRICELEGQIS